MPDLISMLLDLTTLFIGIELLNLEHAEIQERGFVIEGKWIQIWDPWPIQILAF